LSGADAVLKGARVPNPVAKDSQQPAGGPELAQRVARLTPAQLDCLRLVNEHLSSKEIAVRLGISPHTVDQRIAGRCTRLVSSGAARPRAWWPNIPRDISG
jgi:DNA-binding NarL/FixJ family response regulator